MVALLGPRAGYWKLVGQTEDSRKRDNADGIFFVSYVVALSQSTAYAASETIFYIPIVGVLTLLICATTAAALLIAAPFIGFNRTRGLILKSALFLGLVWLYGIAGNFVFVVAFSGRLYYAADPIVDWLPYLPSVNFTIDPMCGGHLLNGATPALFRLAWFAVAFPVWLLAALTCSKLFAKRVWPVRRHRIAAGGSAPSQPP